MLAWFGTVELVLDRRHQFVVSTGLASCLLLVEERKLSNSDLAECMGGIDSQLLRNLVQPLLDSGLLTEEGGMYSIAAPNAIAPAKLTQALTSAQKYTDLVSQSTNV